MTNKKEAFIAKEKTERTIKLKTVIIAMAFVVVALGGIVTGWIGRSNFDNVIRATVVEQVAELKSKQ